MRAEPLHAIFGASSAQERALHPLRTAAEEISVRIRRDRGDGLYILRGQAEPHPYFIISGRDGWSVFVPSEEGMDALDMYLNVPVPSGFAQFAARSVSSEDMRLLCRGIKLLETGCPQSEALQFENDVRRRAAQILRTHDKNTGGALPLCIRIAEKILKERKETEK